MLELGLAVLADILALLESLKLAKVWFIQSSQRDSVIICTDFMTMNICSA